MSKEKEDELENIPFIPDRDDQEYYLSTGLPPFWNKEYIEKISKNLNSPDMKTDHPD